MGAPSGVHIAYVEVDPIPAMVEILDYVAVDDAGVIINPLLATGQIHGGVVQGIGQALYEEVCYDRESGQLLTGSLLDYAVPHADLLPEHPIAVPGDAIPDEPAGGEGNRRKRRDRRAADNRARRTRCTGAVRHRASRHATDAAEDLGRDPRARAADGA